MSDLVFIVWPHCLFSELIPESIKTRVKHIVFIEEPTLIYHAKHRPLRVNKNKIALFRASMKHAFDTMRHSFPFAKLEYVDYQLALKAPTAQQLALKAKQGLVHAWDPCDDVIRKVYPNVTFHTSPQFLLTLTDLEAITVTRHAEFYKNVKKKLKVLDGEKSYDVDNRLALPIGLQIPATPSYDEHSTAYYNEAIAYANSPLFKKHVGDPQHLRRSPITHKQAAIHLEFFITKRLSKFGPYEDAVKSSEDILFHSNISHLLNNGLLTPKQVLDRVLTKGKQLKIPIQSLEGFIRQLIGWREYQRYIYVRHKASLEPLYVASTPYLTILSDLCGS